MMTLCIESFTRLHLIFRFQVWQENENNGKT